MAIDWPKIRNDYINGGGSYRALAEKYGVSATAIANKAKTENWKQAKEEQLHKTCTKLAQKTSDSIVEHEISRKERILKLTDCLIEKMETAVAEIDATDLLTIKGYQQVANALKTVNELQADITQDGKKDTEIEDLAPLAALLNRNDKDTNNTMG